VPSISDRLREAREGLGFSQQVLADRCGVTARSQRNYEAGERFPDAAYLTALAAAGADIRYILTGQREGPTPERLSEDEKALLADYREASGPVRRAARAALQSGSSPPGRHNQVINAPVQGGVAGGNISINSHNNKK